MPTLLMLSRYFPPRFDVGGKRAHRFASVLPELGWRPVVVTGRAPPQRTADPSTQPPRGAVIERVYEPWWWVEPFARPSDGTVSAVVPSAKPAGRRAAFLPGRIDFPIGPDLPTVPHLVRASLEVGRRVGADVVWATSSPYSVLLAGATVARRLGRPLVLDLRDPWTLNFMHRNRAAWLQRVDRRVERELFEQAARVVFTSSAAAEAYRELYPELPPDRIITIRNAFDPRFEPARPDPSRRVGPIRLLHFGNCYGPRRLATILRAMARLRELRPDAPEVVLENLGRVGQADVELARELGLEHAFVWRPFVAMREGLERVAQADLAVLVAYGDETLYVPAKFFDYVLARAPILCLTRAGELAELVEASGAGQAIAPDDVTGAFALIEAAIDARARGQRAFEVDEAAREQFSAAQTTRALVDELEQLRPGASRR